MSTFKVYDGSNWQLIDRTGHLKCIILDTGSGLINQGSTWTHTLGSGSDSGLTGTASDQGNDQATSRIGSDSNFLYGPQVSAMVLNVGSDTHGSKTWAYIGVQVNSGSWAYAIAPPRTTTHQPTVIAAPEAGTYRWPWWTGSANTIRIKNIHTGNNYSDLGGVPGYPPTSSRPAFGIYVGKTKSHSGLETGATTHSLYNQGRAVEIWIQG